MLLDLSHLGRQGRGSVDERFDRTYEASAFADRSRAAEDGYTVAAPVHLSFEVHKDRDVCRLTGRVQTTLELECGRCLEPFTMPVDSPFELRYVPAEPTQAGEAAEREIREDDLTTAFYRGETIDLGELMREQFELALPMKPLCTDVCKGLCPECGTNLNKSTCGCAPKWEDPRLAALKGLLTRETER
jgi:DUF177 domain-containing protein